MAPEPGRDPREGHQDDDVEGRDYQVGKPVDDAAVDRAPSRRSRYKSSAARAVAPGRRARASDLGCGPAPTRIAAFGVKPPRRRGGPAGGRTTYRAGRPARRSRPTADPSDPAASVTRPDRPRRRGPAVALPRPSARRRRHRRDGAMPPARTGRAGSPRSNRLSIWSQRSGVIGVRLLELAAEPGPSQPPIPLDRDHRDPQRRRRSRGPSSRRSTLRVITWLWRSFITARRSQRLVDGDDVQVLRLEVFHHRVERHPVPSGPATTGGPPTSVVDEHFSHGTGGRGEQVVGIRGLEIRVAQQPDHRLVDHRRRRESMVRSLPHHQVGGHRAQLVIHPGEEVVPGPVAPDPAPSRDELPIRATPRPPSPLRKK